MTAFVNGGYWGRGPGGGEQKLSYLPMANTDFVFAVWGEETGVAGSVFLAVLFVALVIVSMRIAMNARDLFGMLLAGGVASLIGLQAAFNMMVTVGLLPTKGLPLPFISMGGTSLVIFLGLMGIVLNVGLDMGVLTPTLFTMMVLMALATTLSTTPVFNLITKGGLPALRPSTPGAVRAASE